MGSKKNQVLDLSSLLPGPFASLLMADLGFEVVKVEDMRNPDPLRQLWPTSKGVSVSYAALNGPKKIIQLDYRKDSDLEQVRALVKESDVIIENYKPGRMEKLGLGYTDCLKLNPKIVMCSITGFGQKHKLSASPAHDLNILGLSGALSFADSFQVPPLPLADLITAYEATIQILSALIRGDSVHLDVSMLSTIVKASGIINSPETFLGRSLKPEEFILWGRFPCYHLYLTADKRFMALAAIEAPFWNDFCRGIGLEEIVGDQFETGAETINKIAGIISTKAQKDWTDLGISCFTPVLTYTESRTLGYV